MSSYTSKSFNLDTVAAWLNQFEHPALIAEWATTSGWLIENRQQQIQLRLPFHATSMQGTSLQNDLNDWVLQHKPQDWPSILIDTQVSAMQAANSQPLRAVKNIVAISSAKGGVGKSTTAVNLALAMQSLGAKVGLLDADIYGPSLPLMLGSCGQKPQVKEDKWMEPIMAHGLATQSIGYLLDDNAAVWRGPMASKALSQLLNETLWPALDYLIIDMPPGTGDIQLTLAQNMPVTTSVIITTPQDLALIDAIKGVQMFNKVNVPVLGVVENMSYHICSQCGHHEAIFGEGGGEKIAQQHHLSLLAQIPLHIDIRRAVENGDPMPSSTEYHNFYQIYQQLASRIMSDLYWQGKVATAIPFSAC